MSNVYDIYNEAYNKDSWQTFVDIHQELYDPIDPSIKIKMSQTTIPKDIQIVLLAKLGEYAFHWIERTIPALDHKTPLSYLQSEQGTNALRAAIMRMPN